MSYPLVVVVDPATLHQSSLGSITGTICVAAEGWFFPEQHWSDFPVVILGWWLQAYRDASSRVRATAVCRFMDGPYSFRLISASRERWTVECVSHDKAVLHEFEVEARVFAESLEAACRTVIRACHRRHWESSGLDALEDALNSQIGFRDLPNRGSGQ
jgi:hypothetical protein